MFANIVVPFLTALLASKVAATPLHYVNNELARRDNSSNSSSSNNSGPPSFNSWNGISSLDGFDNFNGQDNFSGSKNTKVVIKKDEVVCRTVKIEAVQQRLVVLQELMKRIITEQICEVETQVIVFEQFRGGSGSFDRDLRRYSGNEPGYDSSIISNNYGKLINSDGSLNDDDLGFSGSDVGQNQVTIGGNNWNDQTSPSSVNAARDQAKQAYISGN